MQTVDYDIYIYIYIYIGWYWVESFCIAATCVALLDLLIFRFFLLSLILIDEFLA